MKKCLVGMIRPLLTMVLLTLTLGSMGAAATPWLHTSGNWILDPSNNQVCLRGVSVVCPENQTGSKNTNQVVDVVANSATGWYARVVRLPVCTTGNAATDYALIDPVVQHCIAKGLYVIVDLHFVQDYGSGAGQVPQSQVLAFWNTIAPHYASSPNVIFEVFNEPINPVDWNAWKSYIQPVVNAIRSVAPNNLILMGSPQWSQLVNQAVSNQITGGNIVYVHHYYPIHGTPSTSLLDGLFGTAANSVPVVLGEFGWQNPGDAVTTGTTSGFGTPLKSYMEAHKNINWVAWVANNTETNWLPIMFDANWTVLGGENYEGQFVKDWLNADQNDHQPQTGGAPPVPTGLAATAGNAQVALSWSASSGATAYDVKRSTISGSGYATINSPTGTSYTNTGLTNGTTYYYVVAAKNASGSSVNSSQVSATPSAGTQAQIAAGTAAIDGTVEAAWSSAASYNIANITTGTVSSTADLSGTWKGMWDAANLYVLADVTDDVKKNDSTNTYDDDTVEVFVDGNNSKGATYDGSNDIQWLFGWGDAAVVEGSGPAGRTTGISFAKVDPTGTAYRLEIKIPWSTIGVTPAANALIGIDIQVDDDDDGSARDGKKAWWGTSDIAWQNPSTFGTGKLNAGGGGTPVRVNLTPSFNNIGIQNDGVSFSGGLDGSNAYSGNQLGTSKTWGGVTFTIGSAAANDAVTSSGQTITLPAGAYTSLKLLGAAVLGGQANQVFTVRYSDASTTNFTQSISDWCGSQAYAGESIAVPMTYRNQFNGTPQSLSCNVYGYSFALNKAKTLQSITLPSNGNVKVMAITLVP
jgi:fibronectin type 3 domain-containing protein